MRVYPKEPKVKDRSHLRWRMDAELAYDGGGSSWTQYYRTYFGARLAAFWHYHVASWGGSIELTDQQEER